jgi:hypothetical protein
MRRGDAKPRRAARLTTISGRTKSARSAVPNHRAKAQLSLGYFGPTSLNFGLATTILAGSDHDICCAPVGRFRLKPRTR